MMKLARHPYSFLAVMVVLVTASIIWNPQNCDRLPVWYWVGVTVVGGVGFAIIEVRHRKRMKSLTRSIQSRDSRDAEVLRESAGFLRAFHGSNTDELARKLNALADRL